MKRVITVILSIFLIFTALPVLTFAGDNFLESLSHSNAIDNLLNGSKEAPETEQAPETLSLPFNNSFSQIIDQLNNKNDAAEIEAAAPAEPMTEAPTDEAGRTLWMQAPKLSADEFRVLQRGHGVLQR